MSRLVTVPVFAPRDEEANPAEEGDEHMWEDGDSGHQKLGKAKVAFQGEGHVYPVGIWAVRPKEKKG